MKILFLAAAVLAPALLSFRHPPKKWNEYDFQKESSLLQENLWISKTEVSNALYKEFIISVIGSRKAKQAPSLMPDPFVWQTDTSFLDPYVDFYFSHEAFDLYPVVGITHEAAEEFCKWMTERYSSLIWEKTEDAPVSRRTYVYKFRLPTEEEWELAAGKEACSNGLFPGCLTQPQDKKGRWLFNHKLGKGNYAGDPRGDTREYEGYMITAPVKSFFADKTFGLYNMAGNVAEMVAEQGIAKGGSWQHEKEDCTLEKQLRYSEPNAWVGFRFVIEKLKAPVNTFSE